MPDPTIAQRPDRIDAIRRTLLHELRGLADHLADLDRPYAAAAVVEDSQYVRAGLAGVRRAVQ